MQFKDFPESLTQCLPMKFTVVRVCNCSWCKKALLLMWTFCRAYWALMIWTELPKLDYTMHTDQLCQTELSCWNVIKLSVHGGTFLNSHLRGNSQRGCPPRSHTTLNKSQWVEVYQTPRCYISSVFLRGQQSRSLSALWMLCCHHQTQSGCVCSPFVTVIKVNTTGVY